MPSRPSRHSIHSRSLLRRPSLRRPSLKHPRLRSFKRNLQKGSRSQIVNMVKNSNNENNSNSKSEFIINNATEHQLGYKYKNTINNNRRKTLSREYSNQNNIQKLSQPRALTMANVQFPGHDDVKALVTTLKTQDDKFQSKYNFDYENFAYLAIIKNIDNKNISTSKNEGTYLSESVKDSVFKDNNFGKIHPESKKYFLKKGSGFVLLNKIIEDLKSRGIKTIILHSANMPLVSYYERFGFKEITEKIKMFEYEGDITYYGDGNSGPLMYMNL